MMTTAASSTILDRLRALRDARERLADLQGEMRRRSEASTAENAALRVNIDAEAGVVEVEADAVRAMGLTLYHADPANKQPAPGLTVKVMTGVEYDEPKALAWGLEKGIAVTHALDKKAFKSIAPTLDEATKDRLQIKETATATVTIATDLAKALAEAVTV